MRNLPTRNADILPDMSRVLVWPLIVTLVIIVVDDHRSVITCLNYLFRSETDLLRCSASINQHVVPSITYGGRAFSFSVPRPLYQPPDLSLSLDVQAISENVCCIVCSLLITAMLL